MNKSVYLSLLMGMALLATILVVIAIYRSMVSPASADTPDVATIKRLLSAGAEMMLFTEDGKEIWSYHEDPFRNEPSSLLFATPILNNITEQNIKSIISITICADTLSKSDVQPADIQFLGTLPNLESFCIVSGNLSESLADAIGNNLTNASVLWLENITLTPDVWRSLGTLRNVSVLWLLNTNLPTEFFEDGSEMSPVHLMIDDVRISETGLKKLIKTDKLETISLNNTNVSDDITSFFDECPKLEKISIYNSEIKCLFVAQMQHTNKLQSLYLSDTNIDDDILSSVSRYANLDELIIHDSKITEDSIPFLKTLSQHFYKILLRNNNVDLFDHQRKLDPRLREMIESNPLSREIQRRAS